jgi:hypothetical protein
MTHVTIEKKEYIILPKKEYEHLLLRAESKTSPVRKRSLAEGKKLAYKLIDKWAKEK